MVYSYNNTERHHLLMGEKIYTFGDKQASIIEFVFFLIRSVKSKYIYILMRCNVSMKIKPVTKLCIQYENAVDSELVFLGTRHITMSA